MNRSSVCAAVLAALVLGCGGGGGGGGGTALTVTLGKSEVVEGDAPVFGTVAIGGARAEDLVVSLVSSDVSEATVPGSVTIAAGADSASFSSTIVDDAQADGDQAVTITASAAEYASGSDSIVVHDNDGGSLNPLAVIPVMPEKVEAGLYVDCLVSVAFPLADDLVVTLESSDTSEATVPSSCVIRAGNDSARFRTTIVDDAVADGPQLVVITASGPGCSDGSATLMVVDDESLEANMLRVKLGEYEVQEGDTASVSIAVGIGQAPAQDLTVALASDPTEVTLPATVTIQAGWTSATTSYLFAVDDDEEDGDQAVTVTASASGYVDGSDRIIVHDNDGAAAYAFRLGATNEGLVCEGRPGTGAALHLDVPTSEEVVFTITCSDSSELTPPATVTVAADDDYRSFAVPVVDDLEVDGMQTVVITAEAPLYGSASATFYVYDNDTYLRTILELTIPQTYVPEDAGTVAATVSVERGVETDTIIQLQSSDPSEAAVPASVTISAGASSASFDITVVDDGEVDGIQEAWVTASAQGFGDAAGVMCVMDNDGPPGDVYYVKSGAGGAADGSSWADAFDHPQDAADVAQPGDEIWVAVGVYKRRFATDTVLLALQFGVVMFGGFAGTESSVTARQPGANPAVLEGDADGDGVGDVYHVVLGAADARMDGFTVTHGEANGAGDDRCGAGMFNSACSPIVSNCVFLANWADSSGAGMYNTASSSPAVVGCSFEGNSANYGAAMFNASDCSPVIANCTFLANDASAGSGIYNTGNAPAISNCSFIDNTGFLSEGIFNSDSIATVSSCVFDQGSIWICGIENWTGCTLDVSDCVFAINGVALESRDSNTTVANCRFFESGIDVSEFGRTDVTGCVFDYRYGYGVQTYLTTCTLTDCVFRLFQGGCPVYANYFSGVDIVRCSFLYNTRISTDRGCVHLYDNCVATIDACRFLGNDAEIGCIHASNSTAVVTNTVFEGNTGDVAMAQNSSNSSTTLVNCTCVGGDSDVAAVASATSGTLDAVNCILWENRCYRDVVFDDPGGGVTVSYSDIEGGYVGTGNIDADPVFAAKGYWITNGTPNVGDDMWVSGDHYLQLSSPCIDAGTGAGAPAADMEGTPRPQGSDYDIGAYEQ